MAGNTSHLPPEIIDIILPKLSVKPLLRFKSVSKSWNTIISDPVFVKNHHQRSKNSNSGDVFLCYDHMSYSRSNRFCVAKLGDRKFQTLQVFESTPEWKDYLCFCEGVILLTEREYRRFTLWNPSTRTQTTFRCSYSSRQSAFGLCRDPITDDFKVVIVSRSDYYSVYSCKNESWIIMNRRFQSGDDGLDSQGLYVDGATYWVYSDKNVTQILYFDPRDDEFKILQKPENILCNRRSVYLSELRGCLCLYCNGSDDKTVWIWTKGRGIDNKSWDVLMTVKNVRMPIWDFQPLCFVGNKIVVRNRSIDLLLVYSPSDKRFEVFEENGTWFFVRLGWAPVPYMASLFSLQEKRHYIHKPMSEII